MVLFLLFACASCNRLALPTSDGLISDLIKVIPSYEHSLLDNGDAHSPPAYVWHFQDLS